MGKEWGALDPLVAALTLPKGSALTTPPNSRRSIVMLRPWSYRIVFADTSSGDEVLLGICENFWNLEYCRCDFLRFGNGIFRNQKYNTLHYLNYKSPRTFYPYYYFGILDSGGKFPLFGTTITWSMIVVVQSQNDLWNGRKGECYFG